MKNKIYYHGSRKRLRKLKRGIPIGADPRNPLQCLDAIYLTSEWQYALAMAIKPRSGFSVAYKGNMKEGKRPIYFERPEDFNPNEKIRIYQIDISEVENEQIIIISDFEIALDIDSIRTGKKEKVKAGEIFNYFYIDETLKKHFIK